MKKLSVKRPEACIACHSCESACAKAYYKSEDPKYACIRIVESKAEIANIHACTQCGNCADVCPMEAIRKNALGVYMIDRKLCVGCLACMDICPENVICKSHDNQFVTKCTACGICVRACPQDVLEISAE